MRDRARDDTMYRRTLLAFATLAVAAPAVAANVFETPCPALHAEDGEVDVHACYVYADGSDVRVYEESNGEDGLQTEPSATTDADERIL